MHGRCGSDGSLATLSTTARLSSRSPPIFAPVFARRGPQQGGGLEWWPILATGTNVALRHLTKDCGGVGCPRQIITKN
jgi:hypothetical protein